MRIQSNDIVLLDVTDTKKVDIHISSNHPTVQIYNQNTTQETYTPDWSKTSLVLTATVYADSTDITSEIGSNFIWSRKIGDTVDVLSSKTNTLTISTNELAPPTAMVQYICSVTYNEKTSESRIVFARTDVGKDGANGNSAPAVKAQYSEDGTSSWTATLNTSTHKYIRFSYDNGATWTSAIKIAGEDGTSVNIKGTATSKSAVSGTSYYTLVYNSTTIVGASIGDAYLLDGNLYVCVESRDGNDYFMDVGHIQGPQGQKGDSYYLFIRYADNINGSGISASPDGKSYIGFYRSSVNQAPTDVSSATWNWAKFVGEDAKSITLTGNAQVFKVDKSNTILPAEIKVTAQAENTTVTSWSYNTDGSTTFTNTAPSWVKQEGNVVTITGSAMTSNLVTIKASDGVRSDVFTVFKVSDGANGKPGDEGKPAPIVFLTNENITFAANAQGQVIGTTVYCNVVAYSGTTQVVPTVGTILSTELPTGMSIGTITTASNQIRIPIVIANNATLGSSQNVNGVINIPITSPVTTTLQLTWSKINSGAKGDTGVGISSVTVTYGTSTSASTQPTSWQSSVPAVAEGSYLWTRTITDYTDDSIPDTVTYTYAKQGIKGDTGSPGSPVTVSKIEYQSGTSATTAPTGTWSNSVVSVTEGNYLWTKTAFSDGKVAYGVARQGKDGSKGDPGKGISSIVEQYYQSTSATAQSGGSWSATVPTWVDGKYIWTRSVITYTDSTTSTTSPVCVTGQKGSIGGTGVGVSSVDVWYYQSTSSTALSGGSWSTTAPTWSDGKYVWTKTITTYTNSTTDETNAVCITGQKGSTGVGVKSVTEYYLATASSSGVTTSTSGWTTTVQTITSDKKYLWNYEVITYTNNTTSTTTPIIIGVFGNTGNTGKGIKSVTEYYLATASSSNITTSTSGWTTTMQTLTATKKYLWNYELITYTDNTTATINPVIIGVYGDQGVAAVSFQVYAPNGYLLSKELASLTLQTFAYEGSTAITSGATYQWSQLIDEVWTTISGATSTTYTVTQADVLKAKSYRCVMTYKGQTYTSTVTVQDKTDIYNSVMCISSNARGNNCYWVLYTLVYTDAEEIDPLLGPISINAPTSPMSGDYWYAVDETNASVQLKKYNGSSWVNSTDVQSLSYYWDIINNGSEQVPFGDHSKVQVVSCNDFTSTATLMCGVSNVEDGLLTQSSLSLTDASDPIISSTEPTGVIDGQIWIKPNNNGTYIMSIWDATNEMWVVGDMDTRTKVYTNKPSAYNVGDLWITASDTEHSGYLEGTLLRANTSSSTFNESHWSTTLKYDKDLDSIKETLNDLSQYVNITSKGLKIGAQSASGEISPFTSLFTSTELAFYQNSDKLLTLANNQLTAPHIVVEDDLEVQGSISLGNLNLTIESNGSFSFAVSK